MPPPPPTLLTYYQLLSVQEALLETAQKREVAVKYEFGFGKRPDTLGYPADISELAKKGATSFHFSEERWRDPLRLSTTLSRRELDDLRIGWDLVLDIDCPNWKLSKIITWLLIKSLEELDVKTVTVKFSGNKGFHIGVPFESFPPFIGTQETRALFPDGPRKIAAFLLHYICTHHIRVLENSILFGNKYKVKFSHLQSFAQKNDVPLMRHTCTSCGKEAQQKEELALFICPHCEQQEKIPLTEFHHCPRCGKLMHLAHKK